MRQEARNECARCVGSNARKSRSGELRAGASPMVMVASRTEPRIASASALELELAPEAVPEGSGRDRETDIDVDVVVVGGGFSGIATAIRLVNMSPGVHITIVETEPANRFGGIAYGAATCSWEHLLNIQADRITMFREEPDDFVDWANSTTTDRTLWPSALQGEEIRGDSSVPRPMYRQYIANRLNDTLAEHPEAFVQFVTATAMSVVETDSDVRVVLDKGMEVTARAVVLATGHLEPVVPKPFEQHRGADWLIIDPYHPDSRARFEKPGHVLIVGSGLTTFDVIRTLSSKSYQGHITILSRRGAEHKAYPAGHLHAIPELERPLRFLRPGLNRTTVRWAFLRDFVSIRRGFLDDGHELGVANERTWKSLEPAIARYCQQDDSGVVINALEEYKSAIVASRIGTVPEIVASVVEAEARGQIQRTRGTIDAVATADGRPVIRYTGPDGPDELSVDTVVLAVGRNADYRNVRHPLWRKLAEDGVAKPEPVTGLGVAVDDSGRLSTRVFAVGPMRQGQEIVEHGRTGAFVFSIGTLRNQAHTTALHVSQLLRTQRQPPEENQ